MRNIFFKNLTFNKKSGYGSVFVGISDRPGKQFGGREHFDLFAVLFEGDRIAHDQFLELGRFYVFVGIP